MKYRNLGRTGLRVSEVGFGAWAIGGNAHGNSYGPTDDAESVAAVRKAVELGVNLFDTADVYGWGHSERILGEALQGVRDDVLIATKVGGDFYGGLVRMNFSPTYIPFALERSLERLRTDRVDLYQLHNPPLEVLFDEEVMGVLEMLKEKGKVGHVGVSIHEPEEGVAAIGTGSFEAIQLPFNALRLEWLDELFPLAQEKGVGVVAREPLANGFLTGKYTETSAFPSGDIRHRWPPSMMAAYVGAARQLAFLWRRARGALPRPP
jgi:aryl-alcohol dehydrogenase-like predicted oxidoreductase